MNKHTIGVVFRYATTPPLREKFRIKELQDMIVANVNRASVLGNPYTYNSKDQKKPSNKSTLTVKSAEEAVERYKKYFAAIVSYFEELRTTKRVQPKEEHAEYFEFLESIAATPTLAVTRFRDELVKIYQLAIKSDKPVYLASQLKRCSHAYTIADWLNKKLEDREY